MTDAQHYAASVALAARPELAASGVRVLLPCPVCGNRLFLPVAGGYRCAVCLPPLHWRYTALVRSAIER